MLGIRDGIFAMGRVSRGRERVIEAGQPNNISKVEGLLNGGRPLVVGDNAVRPEDRAVGR